MHRFFKNLTGWVLIGACLGYVAAKIFGSPEMIAAGDTHPFYGLVMLIKTAFIKALFMLIAPIIFFSLIDGVVRVRDQASMRRLGAYTIGYYLVTTAIAIAIGLCAVLLWHPWTEHAPGGAIGASEKSSESLATSAAMAPGATPSEQYRRVEPRQLIDLKSDSPARILKGFLLRSLQNPFAALAEVNILAIVLNALLIGLAAVLVLPGESPFFAFIHGVNRVFQKILSWIILLAPAGVFAIVFDFTLSVESNLFAQLLKFSLLVLGATLIHGLIVLPALAYFLGGTCPLTLFRKMGQPFLVALSTASSAATLPFTMRACEEELGVAPSVASFVCPLGATMNMDGTALFEGIAAVFLAHLFDVELGTSGVIAIFTMAIISSIGAPGMPSGSMSGMQMVLLAAGIPLEAIGILLVVERPLDTFRTAVNVEGDIVGALVVNKKMSRGGESS
jgi:Na+/H+-dicarboxylate symporter